MVLVRGDRGRRLRHGSRHRTRARAARCQSSVAAARMAVRPGVARVLGLVRGRRRARVGVGHRRPGPPDRDHRRDRVPRPPRHRTDGPFAAGPARDGAGGPAEIGLGGVSRSRPHTWGSSMSRRASPGLRHAIGAATAIVVASAVIGLGALFFCEPRPGAGTGAVEEDACGRYSPAPRLTLEGDEAWPATCERRAAEDRRRSRPRRDGRADLPPRRRGQRARDRPRRCRLRPPARRARGRGRGRHARHRRESLRAGTGGRPVARRS